MIALPWGDKFPISLQFEKDESCPTEREREREILEQPSKERDGLSAYDGEIEKDTCRDGQPVHDRKIEKDTPRDRHNRITKRRHK